MALEMAMTLMRHQQPAINHRKVDQNLSEDIPISQEFDVLKKLVPAIAPALLVESARPSLPIIPKGRIMNSTL